MSNVISTANDLFVAFRHYVDDIDEIWAASRDDGFAAPNQQRLLWSNDDLLQFANEALSEYHRRRQVRTSTIVDPGTPTNQLFNYALTAGTQTVALDGRIYSILRAYLNDECIAKTHRPVLNCPIENPTDAQPTCFYFEAPELTFDQPLIEDSTLKLRVNRFAFAPIVTVSDTEVLDCRPEDTYSLIHWMAFRAYSKHDPEPYDPGAAQRELAYFEKFIGKRVSSRLERQRQEELQGFDILESRVYP